jgi:hypothetical protein
LSKRTELTVIKLNNKNSSATASVNAEVDKFSIRDKKRFDILGNFLLR